MIRRRAMWALIAAAVVSFIALPIALATPDHGDLQRSDVGRGTHAEAGSLSFGTETDTVVFTFTLAAGATSGWHRHPGAVIVLVKSGTLTTYGLSKPPCSGEDIAPGGAYFEADAAHARWPHFVRNRGGAPVEAVVVAFAVPKGGSPRAEAAAPAECADPA